MVRAAQILEWLDATDDELTKSIPVNFLSAAAYQLAGLPAMALSSITSTENLEGRVLADFLKAKMNYVPPNAAKYWHARTLERTPEDSGSLPLNHIGELVRVLGVISSTLTIGNKDRRDEAVGRLDAMTAFATGETDSYEWLLFFLVNQVTRKYLNDSIWEVLRSLRPTVSSIGWKCLRRFARESCRNGRPLLWPSQKLGVERLASMDSFAMCTPTGSGKTTVAQLAVLQSLHKQNQDDEDTGPLVLYLVPSRALAAEAEASLEKSVRQAAKDVIITGLYGGTDWSITDTWLTSESPTVLICTVEKAEALLRYSGSLLLERLRLLVIDEAHQVGFTGTRFALENLRKGDSREQRLEAFVSRLLVNCPECRVVALSAVAGGIEGLISVWVSGTQDAQPVGGNYRSTRQIIGTLAYRPHGQATVELQLLDGKPLQLQDRDREAFVPLGFPSPSKLKAVQRNSLYKYNECYAFWVAAHFADSKKTVLISVAARIERALDAVSKTLLQWEEDLPTFFLPDDLSSVNKRLYKRCLATCDDYCGTNSLESVLLRSGIASHHGQMPMKVRRLMTELINRRVLPITIATSTLTEGVNLPFDVILLPRVARDTFDADTNRRIPVPLGTSEFLNLAGRAGRPGYGSEGMTLVLVPNSPSTTAKSQHDTQQRQVVTLKGQWKEMLQALVTQQEELGSSPLAALIKTIFLQWKELSASKDMDEFMEWLEKTAFPGDDIPETLAESLDVFDGFLLSALHEAEELHDIELTKDTVEQTIVQLWQKTFAHVSLKQNSPVYELIVKRRSHVVVEQVVPDRDERRRVYRLGFPPQKSKRFEPLREVLLQYLQGRIGYASLSEEPRYNYIEEALELVADNTDFGFSSYYGQTPVSMWKTILRWWLCAPDATSPSPTDLRFWLGFCNSNFDFRFGVAVGAVLSDKWAQNSNAEKVPTLSSWESLMDLPWVAFWLQELLKWGTLDPFVAYLLSRGYIDSRDKAIDLKSEFDEWHSENYARSGVDDSISPVRFREWEESRSELASKHRPVRRRSVNVVLEGGIPSKLRVFPVVDERLVHWYDAAGYLVAQSKGKIGVRQSAASKGVFWLNVEDKEVSFSK
ncbi:MAG: DEAD/DEAH box helicase [Candidatus Methanospirareceae archaeon]